MQRIWEIFGEHGWIWWIVVGLIAGAIAKLLMPGRDPGGWIVTILIGIAGAVLSALIGDMLNLGNRNDSTSLLSATVGALVILIVYRFVATRSRG